MTFIHLPQWLPEADELFRLQTEIPWEQREVTIFGKKVPQPRLTYYMASQGYAYSGLKLQPSPIPAWLLGLTRTVADLVGWSKMETEGSLRGDNSILLNRYRDGSDSIGWHADDEPELGPDPIVASLSLGASRDFHIREVDVSNTGQKVSLGHGDLFIMPAGFQTTHQHAIPKRAKAGERISLTFRRVF